MAAALDRYGAVDVLLANAGIEGGTDPIVDCDVEAFDRVMAVNVRGVWLGLKYVMAAMQERGKGGSIVITSSTAGVMGLAGMAPYHTSKHAVIGLMRCAALEGGQHGIRVNTVNPGPIETRMTRSIEDHRAWHDAARAGLPKPRHSCHTRLRRPSRPRLLRCAPKGEVREYRLR